ncbi:MAG: YfhO family protein, partial [Candidatus Cloacimonadota bacterium]|nr:YfhO family protein [Candidatus Cloacimonadota bacterium]
QSPDSSYVKLENASFNQMKYEIFTDKPTLFVASEIYYPKGWKCFVDGKETEIYKTDHILRSVYIDSAGKHKILFEFIPETFIKYYHVSVFAHILAFLGLIVVAAFRIKKIKNG